MKTGRIEYEKKCVKKMIEIFCRHKEGNNELCNGCSQLLVYAYRRLDCCKFGENKNTCRKCPVHCYKPDMREKMREVMKFSGPRMFFFYPLMAIRHIWTERKFFISLHRF